VTIVYVHGWQSVPGGVKPTFLAQHGQQGQRLKAAQQGYQEAVQTAQNEFDRSSPQVIAGSFRGR
jgi:predicted esterase YcpF (UPF0227 family)